MDIELSKRAKSPQLLTYQSLLSGLKSPENFSFTVNELKTELHRRVINRLYQHCKRLCQKSRLDDSTVKEIVQITLIKALDNISVFVVETSWPEEKFANKVAAWLNTIAYHQFLDLMKERARCCVIDEDYNEIGDEGNRPDEFDFEQNEITELQLQDAMDSLNDREKYIINICMKYNCLDNKNHLPDAVIEDICNSLQLQKGHIRVIKLRALAKLRTMLK